MLRSFNHAFQGLIYAVRHQRNMRVHLVVATGVLVGSIFVDLSRTELLAILVSVVFVLVAELLNSAIETAVDMLTDQFDPRAKAAKDLAAGAVLVAAINALAVAYLVLADRLTAPTVKLANAIRNYPPHVTAIVFGVVLVVVIALKAIRRKGTPLSGGLPSGHAALAFAGWTVITFYVGKQTQGLLASVIALIMAFLVAQSRVETGVHSILEVVTGAILGSTLALLILQLVS